MWAVCFGILFLSWNGKKSWDVQSLVFDHWQQICWLFVDCKSKDAVEQGKFKETFCLLFKRGTDFVHAIFAIGNSSILFDLWAYRYINFVGNLYLHTKCGKIVTVNLSQDIHILANWGTRLSVHISIKLLAFLFWLEVRTSRIWYKWFLLFYKTLLMWNTVSNLVPLSSVYYYFIAIFICSVVWKLDMNACTNYIRKKGHYGWNIPQWPPLEIEEV